MMVLSVPSCCFREDVTDRIYIYFEKHYAKSDLYSRDNFFINSVTWNSQLTHFSPPLRIIGLRLTVSASW